jgi:hypothetical protein
MRSRRWFCACAVGMLAMAGDFALGQGKGRGKGHKKDRDDEDDDRNGREDRGDYYRDRDREEMRHWYAEHREGLPPGLAKRDQLPPGLEKQLVRRGTLPPGLQKRIQPCPPDLEQRLPPPPPDCAHVVIGGHIVLMNRRTNVVLDIFHLEL